MSGSHSCEGLNYGETYRHAAAARQNGGVQGELYALNVHAVWGSVVSLDFLVGGWNKLEQRTTQVFVYDLIKNHFALFIRIQKLTIVPINPLFN